MKIITPLYRVLVLLALTIIYGLYLSPKLVVGTTWEFVFCIFVWLLLICGAALTTVPLLSALLSLTEKDQQE